MREGGYGVLRRPNFNVAKDGSEWDGTLDDRRNHLEEGILAVGDVVVQLISSENHKVWFLDIQDPFNEVNRKCVSLALWQIFPIGTNSIFTYPDTSDHVRVRDLDNLEFAILPYS